MTIVSVDGTGGAVYGTFAVVFATTALFVPNLRLDSVVGPRALANLVVLYSAASIYPFAVYMLNWSPSWTGFSLSDEDIEKLSSLEKGRRFNDPGDFTQGMNSFCPIYD